MYELLLFICGASIMILELAGVRIISPFLGSSHVVYTSIIGIIMASLSIGYWLGGKISSKNPSNKKLSIIILGAGLYIFFLSLFQFDFLRSIVETSLSLILKTIICSIIMFSIPSILLGIISPYTIQLVVNKQQNKENTGVIVGKFSAISTIGSIVGTFLCGFYLILKFGIDNIFFFLSCIIFTCSILYLLIDFKKKINDITILIIQIIIFTCSIFSLIYFKHNPIDIGIFKNAKIIQNITTIYNTIYVLEVKSDNGNIIVLDNGDSGIYKNKNPDEHLFEYIKHFHKIFVNKKNKNNILILGNAAGSFVTGALFYVNKNNLKNINFDIVEIDSELTEIGKKYFGFPKNDDRITLFHEDARTFLNRKSIKKYDLIIYDIYSNLNHIFPYHLVTKETFEKINSKLNENGIFVINVIGSLNQNSKDNKYLRQIYTQINHNFSKTLVYGNKSITDGKQNIIIIACKNPNNKELEKIESSLEKDKIEDIKTTSEIFTDLYSPIEKYL